MTILSEKEFDVVLSIEPPGAKSYSSTSGRVFHSGSHILLGLNLIYEYMLYSSVIWEHSHHDKGARIDIFTLSATRRQGHAEVVC